MANGEELSKLRRANQEVIKQNMQLQGQLRKQNALYQECLRENVELRRQLVELKGENDSLNRNLTELKFSVAERVPTLRLIQEHLGNLTNLLSLLGQPDPVEECTMSMKPTAISGQRPRRSSAGFRRTLSAIYDDNEDEGDIEIYQDK